MLQVLRRPTQKNWRRKRRPEPISKPEKEAGSRRCIICAGHDQPAVMIRMVAKPTAEKGLVADLAQKLPGRGYWVHAGCLPNMAAKAPRLARDMPAMAPSEVQAIAELLRQRVLSLLGMARKAGLLVQGFHKLKAGGPYEIFFHASDGAEDGLRKLKSLDRDVPVLRHFDSASLASCLGEEHVVHVGLTSSRLTTQIYGEVARLEALNGAMDQEFLKDRLERQI
jgi:Predicted nucleic-acid-binding protein implicated in transcription termination